MTSLRETLEATSWRLLKLIGRQRGLRFGSNIHKADLIERIEANLAEPANLGRALDSLPEPERRALDDLLLAGGRLPRRYLESRYGAPAAGLIVARRPGNDLMKLSSLERLVISGFVFQDRISSELFIPEELICGLPQPTLPPPPVRSSQAGQVAPVDLLCCDLATLLALLQRERATLLHQRWLPPHFLAAWGRACLHPPDAPAARSELQTGRRRFLHYLAESAGLVTGPGPILTLTPAAWGWLNAPYGDRLQQLWQAWIKPNPERWARFRLPGSDWLSDPAALLGPIHKALPGVDPADPALFAETLLRVAPQHQELAPANALDPFGLIQETVRQLLAGPLQWLGVLVNDETVHHSAPTRQGFMIHPSAWNWLDGRPIPETQAPLPAQFFLELDDRPDLFEAGLHLVGDGRLPAPVDLMAAIEISEPAQAEAAAGQMEAISTGEIVPGSLALRYRVTPASFIRALHRGWSPQALRQALERLANRSLADQELRLIYTWSAAADRMRISPVMLLESSDPGLIRRLASEPRGRALIQRSLSARAVVVSPERLKLLARRLEQQEGIPARISQGQGLSGPAKSEAGGIEPAIAPQLWLAVQLYQRLGAYIALPVHLPQLVFDLLAERLSLADLAAAEVAVEQVMQALRRALDGESPFPTWYKGEVAVAESAALIEAALANGRWLQLTYYSAGRDVTSRRLVEPYRLERRGETLYLVGFCQQAQAERVFRVDRIESIRLIEPDDPPELPDSDGW